MNSSSRAVFAKKVLGGALSAVFLYSTVASPLAEANFWADREAKAKAMNANESSGQMAQMPASLQDIMQAAPVVTQSLSTLKDLPSYISNKVPSNKLPDWMKSLPLAYGDVQDVTLAPGSGKWVVLVSDVHAVEEAQRNISRILEHLAANAKSGLLVGLEGAAGPFNFKPYRELASPRVVQIVANHLVKLGYINGAQHFALTTQAPASLFGVETPEDYLGNVKAFFDSRPFLTSMESRLKSWQAELSELKKKEFAADLLALDTQRGRFQKGELPLKDYLKTLQTASSKTAQYPALAKFLEAMRMEDGMDFKAVEQERTLLLEKLAKTLDKAELADLVGVSMSYRAGQISYGTFYRHFKELCQAHNLSLSQCPAFDQYVKYLMLADSIDRRAVFSELIAWEEDAAKKLSTTATQKELWSLSKDADLADKLVHQSLTTQEWSLYQSRRTEIQNIPDRLSKVSSLSPQGGRGWPEGPGEGAQSSLLNSFESFYAFASRRDHSMSENFLAQANNKDISVLIAGGFHSAGMAAGLKKSGFNVLTISPKLTKVGNENYMAAFTREHTPLDKVLMGEKLFLSTPVTAFGDLADPIAHSEVTREPVSKERKELLAIELATALEVAGGISWDLLKDLVARRLEKAASLVEEAFPQYQSVNVNAESYQAGKVWKITIHIEGQPELDIFIGVNGFMGAINNIRVEDGIKVDSDEEGGFIVVARKPAVQASLQKFLQPAAEAASRTLARPGFMLNLFPADFIENEFGRWTFRFAADVLFPFLETLLLVSLTSTIGYWSIPIFAFAHIDAWVDLFRKEGDPKKISFPQFLGLALLRGVLGTIFVGLLAIPEAPPIGTEELNLPLGFWLSWGTHSLWNAVTVERMLNKDRILDKIARPAMMLGGLGRGETSPLGAKLHPEAVNAPGPSQYGYYDDENREYVVTDPNTPSKWVNYIGTLNFGGYIDHTGGMNLCKGDPATNRITRYDVHSPDNEIRGTTMYVRKKSADGTVTLFSPFHTPVMGKYDKFECRMGLGYNRYISEMHGIRTVVTIFVPEGGSQVVQDVQVTNLSGEDAEVDVIPAVQYSNPSVEEENANADFGPQVMESKALRDGAGEVKLIRQFPHYLQGKKENFFASSRAVGSFTTDRKHFIGAGSSSADPSGLKGQGLDNYQATGIGVGDSMTAAIISLGKLAAHTGSSRVVTQVGQANIEAGKNIEDSLPLIERYRDPANVDVAFAELQKRWKEYLEHFEAATPDADFNRIVNVLAPRQNNATFWWSRYLSPRQLAAKKDSRGIGTRDSNQDLVGTLPYMTAEPRQMIENLLAIQRKDGSSMHQYNPLTKKATTGEAGENGFYCDDHLWGILSVVEYIKETGDMEFLKKEIPYYGGKVSGTVLDHLKKALLFTKYNVGVHGLPLLGHADWNDAVNFEGEGAESVMAACLYGKALMELSELMRHMGNAEAADHYMADYDDMKRTVNTQAWNGEWYTAYFRPDGKPEGSNKDKNGPRIYNHVQTWAINSGFATPETAKATLDSIHRLLMTKHGVKTMTPGYPEPVSGMGATGYPTGAKENAGVFLHLNPWDMESMTKMGRGAEAMDLLDRINPLKKDVSVSGAQPDVLSQNTLSDEHPNFGLTNNPWLSGTVTTAVQATQKSILGLQPTYGGLRIDPVIPESWPGFTVNRVYRGVTYEITVQRGRTASMTVDDETVEGNVVPFTKVGDKKTVKVVLTLGGNPESFIEKMDKEFRERESKAAQAAENPALAELQPNEPHTLTGEEAIYIYDQNKMEPYIQYGTYHTVDFPATGVITGAPTMSIGVSPAGDDNRMNRDGAMLRFGPSLRRASLPVVHVDGKKHHLLTMLKPPTGNEEGEYPQDYPPSVDPAKTTVQLTPPAMTGRFDLGDVRVTRTTTSPILSGADVTLPASVDVFRMSNPSKEKHTVTLVFSKPSLVKKGRLEMRERVQQENTRRLMGALEGQEHTVFDSEAMEGVVMGVKGSEDRMAIAVPKMKGVKIAMQPYITVRQFEATTKVQDTGDFYKVYNEPPEGLETGAAIAVTVDLEPGAEIEIPFSTVYDFPEQEYVDRVKIARAYTANFPNSETRTTDMAWAALSRHEEWQNRAAAIQKGVFSLVRQDPAFKNDRRGAVRMFNLLFNEIAYLLANASVWTKDGVARFLECFDYPFNNSADVDWYSMLMLMIFPKIEKQLCQKFIDSINDQNLGRTFYHWHAGNDELQKNFLDWERLTKKKADGEILTPQEEERLHFLDDDVNIGDGDAPGKTGYKGKSLTHICAVTKLEGSVSHDVGALTVGNPLRGKSEYNWYNTNYWVDLFPKLALRTYRNIKLTQDEGFLRENDNWNTLKKGFEYLVKLDKGNGVPEGNAGEVRNTFDNIRLFGYDAYSVNLFMASCLAMSKMADMMKDDAAKDRYDEYYRMASAAFDKLWIETKDQDGEPMGYYATCYDPKEGDYNREVFLDQLDGLWSWVAMGEEPFLPEDRVKEVLRTVYRHNRVRNGWATQRKEDGGEAGSDQGKDVWIACNYVLAQLLYYYGMNDEFKNVQGVMDEVLLQHDNTSSAPESVRPNENKYIVKGYPRPGAVWTQLMLSHVKAAGKGGAVSSKDMSAFLRTIFNPAEVRVANGKPWVEPGEIRYRVLGRMDIKNKGETPVADNSIRSFSLLATFFKGKAALLNVFSVLLNLPAVIPHELKHLWDAWRLGVDMSGVRWWQVFTGGVDVDLNGPRALGARNANYFLTALGAIATALLLTFGVHSHGTTIAALITGWVALSNLLTGLAEELPRIPYFARRNPKADLLRSGWKAENKPKALEDRRLVYRLNHGREPGRLVRAWMQVAEFFSPINGRFNVETFEVNGKPAYRFSELATHSFFEAVPDDRNQLMVVKQNGLKTFSQVKRMFPWGGRQPLKFTLDGKPKDMTNFPTSGDDQVVNDYKDGYWCHSNVGPWKLEKVFFGRNGIGLRTSFENSSNKFIHGVFEDGGVTLDTSLNGGKLGVALDIRNSTVAGYLDHNFIDNIAGEDEWWVLSPANARLETQPNTDTVPTGNVITFPNDGTHDSDLRKFTRADHNYHGIWTDLNTDKDGWATSYLYNARNGQLIIVRQQNLPFITVYIRPGPEGAYEPSIALEPASHADMSFSDPTGKLGPHQRDRRYKAKVVYESQSFVDEKGKPLPISEVAKRLKVGVKGAPAAAPKAERAGNGNLPFGPALQRSLMDRVRGKDAAGAQSMLARYEDRSQLGLTRLTEALPGVYDWIVLTARSGKHRGNLVLAQIVSRDSDDVVTYKVFGSGEEDYLVSSELISHAKNVFEVGRDTEERSASRWEAVKRWLGFGPKRAPTAGLPGEGKPPATAPTPLIPRNQAVAAELASMTFTMGLELPSVLAELNVVHEQFSPRTRTPVQLNLEGTTEARELLAAFTGNVAGDNAPEALAQQAVATVLASNADSHMNPRDVAEQVWQRVMPVLAASARVRGVTVNTDWAKPMLNRVTVVVRGALENHAVNAMDVSLLFEAEPDDPLRLAVEAQLRDVLNGNRPVAIFCANMAQDELENRLAVYTAQASNRQFVLIGNPATTGKADMARVKMKAASRLGLASIFLRIYTDNPDRLTNLDRAAVLEILRILAGMKLEPVLSLPSLLEAKVTDIQA